ncbi:MAG: nitrogen regulation protein NR(II) [Sandaracinaceae bacterium]
MTSSPGASAGGARSVGARQLWLLGGRLVAATLLLGGNLVAGPAQGSVTQDTLRLLIAATFGISLLAAVALPRAARPSVVAWAQVAWDLLLVTGLVYLFDGAASGFSFLYGVVILGAALVIGPRATQITTAAAIVMYAATALGLANGWIHGVPGSGEDTITQQELALALLRNVVGLVLVGLLAGGLAERLERAGGELALAEESAAGYARLNEDIMRSLASGLATLDPEGRISRINPAGAALLGARDESELIGRAAVELLPLRHSVATEARSEGEATRLDGSTFAVGYGRSELRDADGQVVGTLVLFQDLTELNQLRDTAQRAERLAALGRLSAGLAHEIRNPLGSIAGSVELVMDASSLGEEDRRLLELVLRETDRLNDLVGTMLDIGRPRDPELARVDLTALATEVAKLAGGEARVAVRAPDAPVIVHADPGQIRQVLWNLVKNALQFSPARESVSVHVTADEGKGAGFAVTDRGPGIAPEDRAHVFDMFFSKRHHGVGLGLALAKQIVEAHRGAILVESEVGEGATFRVYLPSSPRESASPAPSAPASFEPRPSESRASEAAPSEPGTSAPG